MMRLIIALAFLAVSTSAAALDRTAFLHAIAHRESGNKPHAIGPRGERSQYQFTAAIWRFHTTAPFMEATTRPDRADWVAVQHYDQLCAELRHRRIPLEPKFIAAAWHRGSGRARRYANHHYAQDVTNLYRDFISRRGGR